MARHGMQVPLVAVAWATALVLIPFAAPATTGILPASGGALLVGYAGATPPLSALASAGATLVATDPALGLAIAWSEDPLAALARLQGAPGIDFAEREASVIASGFNGDSHRWDSHRWDSHRWDSHRWDSHRWDSHRWDSHRWDSHRWDGDLTPDPLVKYQWGLGDLNVPAAWSLGYGRTARTICVLDSGVDYGHPDLAPNVRRSSTGSFGYDFVNGDDDPMDDAGHGTHMAGIAAARIGNGIGTAGVVDAGILAVKVLNARGVGGNGAVAMGLRYCADEGADVISMSFGSDKDSQAVKRAVDYAASRGALLVASAGNGDGCRGDDDKGARKREGECLYYPAAYSSVIGIAPLDLDGAPAEFARASPAVELAAPGVRIAGPIPGAEYALGSGASQATALVAGLAALVWDAHPSLDAAGVRDRLVASAIDLGPRGWDARTGYGEPDALAAVAAPS